LRVRTQTPRSAFEVIEEGCEAWSVEVCQVEVLRGLADPLLGEPQQQGHGVAVCGHRVPTDSPLCDQAVGEERLDRRDPRFKRWTAPNRCCR
jgi:hypothetical protein